MRTKIEMLTTKEYGKRINKSRQAVLRAIKKTESGNDKMYLLPKLIKFKKLGRDYLLEVAV